MYDYSGNYQPYLNLEGTKEEMLEVIERLDFDYITLGRTRQYDADEVATRILEQKRGS